MTEPKIMTVFLPWRSEFGQMIMNYVRWVHRESQGLEWDVMVCCRRGDEVLFPDATMFFYDWEQVPDEKKNNRLVKSERNRQYLERLKDKIIKVYPDYSFEFVDPPRKMEVDLRWSFVPMPRTIMGELDIDVLLCPRWREYGKHRNYAHWKELANFLQFSGLKVALAGIKETSVDVPTVPEELKTWNYDNLDSTLHFMNRAKIVVATDAGLAHLAVLNQSPLFVIYDQPGKEAGKPKWPWVLPRMQKYAKAKCDPIINGWNNPILVADTVCEYLGCEPPSKKVGDVAGEMVRAHLHDDSPSLVQQFYDDDGPPPEPRHQQNLIICSMVYGYQKRYWWQLSSLLLQEPWEGNPVPNIVAHADISAKDADNYGWNDALFTVFNRQHKFDGWNFVHTQHKWPRVEPENEDPYGRRGHIRSYNIKDVLKEGWADWILFNDADMVYDPQFFSHLMTLVDPDEQRVYATPRWTMKYEDGYLLVDGVKYRVPIDDPVGRIKRGVTKKMWQSRRGAITGAGFFQLVSVKALRKLVKKDPGFLDYVPSGWNRDHNTLDEKQTHITRSDKKFRTRLGGIVPIHPKPQYHLNHFRRDSPEYEPGKLH